MAVIKQLRVPSGVVVNYARISKAEVFPSARFVQVTVDLFLSEEERAAGSPLVYQERLQVPFAHIGADLMPLLYGAVVTYPDSPLFGGEASQDPDSDEGSAAEPSPDPSADAPNVVETVPVSPPAA